MNRALLLTFCAVFALPLLESQGVSAQQGEAYDPEARLAELGITLPEPPSPVANYVNGVRTGNLIFLAGKGPKRADGSELHGKLGADALKNLKQLGQMEAQLEADLTFRPWFERSFMDRATQRLSVALQRSIFRDQLKRSHGRRSRSPYTSSSSDSSSDGY